MREKVLSTVFCIAGAAAIAYGMVRDNDILFVAGVVMVAGAYLMIRKGLRR